MSAIAIIGTGNIGAYVGGRLLHAGSAVQFIGRPRMADVMAAHGLTLSDYHGWHAAIAPEKINFIKHHADTYSETHSEINPDNNLTAAAINAALILITVKSASTESAANICRALPPGKIIISLQNGLHNATRLKKLLPQHTVLTGMVPFNVAQQSPANFHQGTQGVLAVEHCAALAPFLSAFAAAGLPLEQHANMPAVQWAKLLFNLNNAVNALSGLPLKQELSQRAYRQVLGMAQREALQLLREKNQPLAKLTPLPAAWVPTLLNTPDWAFRLLANKMLAIDPLARSSMQDDLRAQKKTEIDYLQGEIMALATAQEKNAPVNAALLNLVRAAEHGGKCDWSGAELLAHIKKIHQ